MATFRKGVRAIQLVGRASMYKSLSLSHNTSHLLFSLYTLLKSNLCTYIDQWLQKFIIQNVFKAYRDSCMDIPGQQRVQIYIVQVEVYFMITRHDQWKISQTIKINTRRINQRVAFSKLFITLRKNKYENKLLNKFFRKNSVFVFKTF